MRPDKDTYYLKIAEAVSLRSTCLRRHYGAVLVKDDVIVATGYNGSARGAVNCCDTGYCEREARGATHNSDYTSDCPAIHAENNCLLSAGRQNCLGATLYLYGYDCKLQEPIKAEPCVMCQRLIQTCGIKRVVGYNPNSLKNEKDRIYKTQKVFLGLIPGQLNEVKEEEIINDPEYVYRIVWRYNIEELGSVTFIKATDPSQLKMTVFAPSRHSSENVIDSIIKRSLVWFMNSDYEKLTWFCNKEDNLFIEIAKKYFNLTVTCEHFFFYETTSLLLKERLNTIHT